MSRFTLKKLGFKTTLPRVKILELLQAAPSKHLSAEEIHKSLKEMKHDVGLATVYRVLTQFVNVGLVISHNFEEGHSVFELDTGKHHDHLICVKCGEVEEFVDAIIEARQVEITRNLNFKTTNHHHYIFGFCKNCH
ncbi:MAG: fur [Francisellaceae bacterium]|nr:fur [Francisellaceae bacterium]